MPKLNVNGKVRDVQVEADTPLLWVLREQVGLTGTKYGCGVARCGAPRSTATVRSRTAG
jgi:isoquinoline 1-oxidoreductase subunit alpha